MMAALIVVLVVTLLPVTVYLLMLGLSRRREVRVDTTYDIRIVGVSIVVPCFNEERNIERKINELYAGCVGLECFEIIVICDGCTDDTPRILEKFANAPHFSVFVLSTRQGKAAALNFGVKCAKYGILVFSDTRQIIGSDAIKQLIADFSDPAVGAVSASLVNGERQSVIRSVLNNLKTLESNTGSTVGVYGSLYAIRKMCYCEIPDNTILDDLLIPLQVIKQGKRVLFKNTIMVYDLSIEQFYSIERTVRINRGLIQIIRNHHHLIKGLSVRYIFYLFCQKYYKLLLPFLMIILCVLCLLCVDVYLFIGILFTLLISMILIFRMQEVKLMFRLLYVYIFKLHEIRNLNRNKW